MEWSWPWLVPIKPWMSPEWVDLLRNLGPAFPGVHASDEDWHLFVTNCSVWPGILFSLGSLASLGVLLRTLCFPGRGGQAPTSRPSSKPLSCVGILALLLILFGATAYLRVGWAAAGTAYTQLESVTTDVGQAESDTHAVMSASNAIVQALDAVPPQCSQFAQAQLGEAKKQVKAYGKIAGDCNQVLSPLKTQLDRLGEWSNGVVDGAVAGPLLPAAVVAFCCVTVLFAVWFTHTGRCAWCCIRSFGPFLFAPTVFFVSVAAAVQLGLGVVTSSFCTNPDASSLSFIARYEGLNSTAFTLSEFYIEGSGRNPILDNLTMLGDQVHEVQQEFDVLRPILELQCPSWHEGTEVANALSAASQSINSTANLLAPDRIYKYYETGVRTDLCEVAINGLAWLVVLQSVAGIVCVPVLTFMADRYLSRWSRWRASQDASRRLLTPGAEPPAQGPAQTP